MIRLDYRDARPIYEQVRDGLRSLMVTSDGEDFITIFFNALEKAKKMQIDLTIENV